MALNGRKWVVVMAAMLGFLALLVWAWFDGGERPVGPMTAPAMVPGAAR